MRFFLFQFFIAWILLSGCTRPPPSPAAEAMDTPEVLEKTGAPEPPGETIAVHYKDLRFPDFTYVPPHPKNYRVALNDKAAAYFLVDSTLPLVDIEISLDNRNAPSSKSKLVPLDLYGSLMVSGGTSKLKPQAMEDSLEFAAARLSIDLSDYGTELSLSALSKDTYTLLGLLGEAALDPGLDREIFNLNKKKYLQSIEHRFDTPGSVLGIAYENVMFGKHPTNWLAGAGSAAKVKYRELKAFRRAGLQANKMVAAVSGYFDPDSMKTALTKLLAQFDNAGAGDTLRNLPPFDSARPPGIYIVDKDFEQASVKVGFPGVKRPHADYYPLTVASYIFGAGGFTSRLTAKVRTDEGLAYSVHSFVGSDYYREETVGFYLQTKVASAGKAVSLCFSEMRRMLEEGITEEELARAKSGLIQSLPSLFDSPEATANVFAQSEIWSRDMDHFEQYPKIISALTRDQVMEAFKRYFNPEKARVVIAGKAEAIKPQFESSHSSLIPSQNWVVLKPEDFED